jgi:hypothetical protein
MEKIAAKKTIFMYMASNQTQITTDEKKIVKWYYGLGLYEKNLLL